MNTFSARSIGWYSLAIAGAVAFFQLVTSYGEANIRAPIGIAGNYRPIDLQSAGCRSRQPLLLTITQSGEYLHASLDRDDLQPLTLVGRLHDRQLTLNGMLSPSICTKTVKLHLTGTIAPNRQLQGQLWLADAAGNQLAAAPSDFTATFQSPPKLGVKD